MKCRSSFLIAMFLAVGKVDAASWDAMLYEYENAARSGFSSAITRGNTREARFDLNARQGGLSFYARPILGENPWGGEAYLSQWRVRKGMGAWSAALGRELLNFGPAQFRSPSSPYYFDNGRSDPVRELSGIDLAKLSWTPDLQDSFSFARIAGSGYGMNVGSGWLAKWDRRGEDWAASVVGSSGPFLGLYGQYTFDDAWMFYGESGSGRRYDAPVRNTDWLAGVSRTGEDGGTVYVEYLHYGHGHSGGAAKALQATIPTFPANSGIPLLGRNYLYCAWQGNPMDGGGFSRLMAVRSLNDGGIQLSAYAEHLLSPRFILFALGSFAPWRQEFSTLVRASLTLGIRVALP